MQSTLRTNIYLIKARCTNLKDGVLCGREEDSEIYKIDFATGAYECSICRRGDFSPIAPPERARMLKLLWLTGAGIASLAGKVPPSEAGYKPKHAN